MQDVSDAPLNIQEFNAISGLIFAQLYEAFPQLPDIDRDRIAKAMGVTEQDWEAHKMPSGQSFNMMLAHTIGWLSREGYIAHYGPHPASRVVLTEKGLVAMSAKPEGLGRTVGTALKEAASGSSWDLSAIGDLIGGTIGGFVKSATN
jgi:hypothetical protein